MARAMEIATPLGEDVLLFHGMHAREELSRVSEFQIDLLSDRVDINADELLGQSITVRLELPDEGERFFNGFVTRFSQSGTYGRYYRYLATVRPWLWFLSRTADCRIFQEMTVPDILKEVFADHATADFVFELTGAYRTWTYCVQYRETDLNFVSRLLEHEGIYYYFRHTDGHNTLVLTDSSSMHVAAPGYETLPFIPPGQLVRPDDEHVSAWEFAREVQPGVYVHDDYDLTRPSVELQTQKVLSRAYQPSDYEIYDYPGGYLQQLDGDVSAGVRIDELGSQFETADGTTNARGLTVGCTLELDRHPRDDQNREYLVLATSYDLEFGEYEGMPTSSAAGCQCSFVAMSTAQQFRPRRVTPKPFVQGPQTAVVVGPAGDEIYTDEFGRVKVQFHWDRLGTKDENSSCWIRVSHPWAGKGWGSVATPRIGQEVIVDFLEGDPDRPIITGRVYNAEQTPPFGFPAGAVVSGIKSQTHKGSGYNEISADDTAGQERITIHGQYDMNTTVQHDQTDAINNNRTTTIAVDDAETVGSNQTITVGADQSETIGSNQIISVGADQTVTIAANQTESVGSNQSVSVGSSKTETISVAKALSIGAAYQVSVGGAMNETVGAAKAEEIGGAKIVAVGGISSESVGGAKSVSAGGKISETAGGSFSAAAGTSLSLAAGGDLTASSKAKVGVNAASQLVLKCGGASITLKSGGQIVIKGTDITIKGSNASVKASGKVSVNGSGGVKLKGPSIGEN